MKTRKGELIVVLSLLISASFLFFGCPPPGGPDDGGVDPGNSGGGGEPQLYEIRLDHRLEHGTITVDPATRRAARGTRVKITLIPEPGYEPYNLAVYDVNHYDVPDFAPAFISNVYEYSFTMVASPVTIFVQFPELDWVINQHALTITAASSWEQMEALNALIDKAADPNNQFVIGAIEKLVGVPRNTNVVPTATPFTNTDYTRNIFKRYEGSPFSPGVIRTKIRNADLKPWLQGMTKWPSSAPEKGAELILYYEYNDPTTTPPATTPSPLPGPNVPATSTNSPTTFSDTLGTDLTILYYVKEDYPTVPPVVPARGWRAGGIAEVNNINNSTLFPNYVGPNLDAVYEIPLVFEVGIDQTITGNSVRYKMWMWPVAQYTVQYKSGASGDVTLRDYELDPATNPGFTYTPVTPPALPVPIPPNATGGSPWVQKGGTKTLSTSNSQVTGYVGKATPATAIATATLFPGYPRDREMLVEVSTTRQNVLISVYTSNGNLVSDINGDLLNDINLTTAAGGTAKVGYFYPESRHYIIEVRPSTPPTGL
jgi:hypothetical protein